ncbi:hypothetical protein BKA15_005034 [Microlunatus parietis]|uniref:Uncharacterized protein n=1 Tax=Microlunatus parietis TaxID=682979 RepID=A0A7Y9IBK3_9ACTN|nr:hypothetical protein [Microlunatus parietis]
MPPNHLLTITIFIYEVSEASSGWTVNLRKPGERLRQSWVGAYPDNFVIKWMLSGKLERGAARFGTIAER